MGASELMEWQTFWNREPWGPYRDNVHIGILASLIVNALRRKGTGAVSYKDFMLVDRSEHKQRETDKFITWLKAVGKKKGGKHGKQ